MPYTPGVAYSLEVGWGAHGSDSLEDLLAELTDYALVALDAEGRIRTWNAGAEQLLRRSAEEALGGEVATLHPSEDRWLAVGLLATARRTGRADHRGWQVRGDGSRFWADVVITALHGPDGGLTGYAVAIRDHTGQRELEQALASSEERYRVLVSQVQDYAILALDTHGVIETWNLGAERVKGYTAAEAIGQNFDMFYTPEDRLSGLPTLLLDQARQTGRVEHTGWRLRKDGSRFWADVVITALHDEHGRLTGYAKVTRDRTDLKALEEAQDAFYAAFDHDFRTPLTAIKGFVDALRDADERERDGLMDRADATADTLLAMVEDLVRFAVRRSGHASLTLHEVDLAQLARTAAEDLPTELGAGRVVVDPGMPLARADELAMHRVVTNLLANALKYSEPPTPVRVTFSSPGPARLRMEVSDQGRGIDPDDVGTIFDEFTRGRLAEDDGGTGMGLTSVRELVEEQQGVVSLDSVVGVGTTVAVELPTTQPPVADPPAQRPAPWVEASEEPPESPLEPVAGQSGG